MAIADDPQLEIRPPPLIFSRLKYGNWNQWPKAEQSVIREYLSALWSAALATEPDESRCTHVDDWLSGIAPAEDQLSPYLQTWYEDGTFGACLNLAWFVAHTTFIQNHAHDPDFWSDRKDQFQQVKSWIAGHGAKLKM
jgi:hypothetical protein